MARHPFQTPPGDWPATSGYCALRTGWSQETLALDAGLDRTFVGAIERAERNITLASAEKIANAFGMTVADLLTHGDIHKR